MDSIMNEINIALANGIEWTQGAFLFYGGLAGVIITIFAALIAAFSFSRGRKRLLKKLHNEYGNK